MKTFLHKVKQLISEKHNVEIPDNDLNSINEIILAGNKKKLFQIEMNLCNSQKQHCVDKAHYALDSYHHEGMETEEIKTILGNVLMNKAVTPDITDTVRLLIQG